MDFQSVCFLQHVAQKWLFFYIKFLCQIEKKVVGSAQKFRVGRGAPNTAIFFFFGLIISQVLNYIRYLQFRSKSREFLNCFNPIFIFYCKIHVQHNFFLSGELPTRIDQSQDLMLRSSTVSFLIVHIRALILLSFHQFSCCILLCPLFISHHFHFVDAGYLFVTDILSIPAIMER